MSKTNCGSDKIKTPWLAFAGYPEEGLPIFEGSMVGLLDEAVKRHPGLPALHFLGKEFTYASLLREINLCARALQSHGIQPGDAVLVSLPNVPNAIILLYALNRIGARACFSHPLSSAAEQEYYAKETGSRVAITLDLFFGRFNGLLENGTLNSLIIARISDYLPPLTKTMYNVTRGRKNKQPPLQDTIRSWKDFIAAGRTAPDTPWPEVSPEYGCVVLFSGGTTQLPKGIMLSSRNFNALASGAGYITHLTPGDNVLAILPVFHGFGLGLCIHTCLCGGVSPILIPEFSTKNYINCLLKHKPAYIAGVPTLFEALLRDPNFAKARFENLKGAYCGGDSLYPTLKHRFDEKITAQGSTVVLKEGYGLTETVTACMISPDRYKEGSMGIPLPHMLGKVVEPDTEKELPYGTEGEICVAGPLIMQGYLNAPEDTEKALRRHADGQLWLHTGDLGTMDDEGYFYFKNRIKRIVKVSGISVYPAQVEQVLETHPLVSRACVIGVPDDYQMTSLKAFVMLKAESEIGKVDEAAVQADLTEHCKKQLIKWSVPRAIEIREKLPTTLVGKVAYTELEKEEAARREKAQAE